MAPAPGTADRIDAIHRNPVDTPGGAAGDVLLVEFTVAGQAWQALNGAATADFTDAVSFSVACDDQAEVDRLWDALAADGGAPMACGWIRDRFGVRWQVVPRRMLRLIADPDRARAGRVMQAMMEMVKIDLAAIERAAAG